MQDKEKVYYVKDWTPVNRSTSTSSINKNPTTSQTGPSLHSSSSFKDFQSQPSGGILKDVSSSSQQKNVAFQSNISNHMQSANSNPSTSKQNFDIFYDISAGRGDFDEGYPSDYSHSIKQSQSVGNLSFNNNNNGHRRQNHVPFHPSSSMNSFPRSESSGFNQGQKNKKPNRNSNGKYYKSNSYNSNRGNSNRSYYSNRNSNNNNNSDTNNSPGQTNFQPRTQPQPQTQTQQQTPINT